MNELSIIKDYIETGCRVQIMILSSRVKERKSKKESNIDHLFFFFPFFPLDLVWRGLGELVTELSLASVVSGQELLRVTPPRHS